MFVVVVEPVILLAIWGWARTLGKNVFANNLFS